MENTDSQEHQKRKDENKGPSELEYLKKKEEGLKQIVAYIKVLKEGHLHPKTKADLDEQNLATIIRVDIIELDLKKLEIKKLEGHLSKSEVLKSEKEELAIMEKKISLEQELLNVLKQIYSESTPELIEKKNALSIQILELELSEKTKQVASLQLKVSTSIGNAKTKLQALLDGEIHEVTLLKELIKKEEEITSSIRNPKILEKLEKESYEIQIKIKEYNIHQVASRIPRGARKVVQAYFDALKTHNSLGALELCADNVSYTNHSSGLSKVSGSWNGKSALQQFWVNHLNMWDVTKLVSDIVIADDTQAVALLDWVGVARATGKQGELQLAQYFKIQNGLIVKIDDWFDSALAVLLIK